MAGVAYLLRALAALALSGALPVFAHDAAHPDTAARLKEAVEQYYQAKPSMRPTPAWLAANPGPTCSKPRYPRAGLRDELKGTTALRFDINADGLPVNAQLVKSSGWAVLDEAAIEALSVCVFPVAPATEQSVAYRFYFG